MMAYTLEQIASFVGARLCGCQNKAMKIGRLLTDSRSLCFPESTLFFALETERNDGHKYISDLYKRGVRAFVVSRLQDEWTTLTDATFLQVVSPIRALQRLAERHRESFDIPIIGITGSNGKTVVKEWLYQLLSKDSVVTRSPRSYNSQIGVPLSVWALTEQTEIGVFEAGISQPHEMDALQSIIQPTTGVFTYLGEAHQENFESLEQKVTEKLKLFKDSNTLVYCKDDIRLTKVLSSVAFKGNTFDWSFKDENATLYVSSSKVCNNRTEITYIFNGTSHRYSIPFIDEASKVNSITCLAVCLLLGLTPNNIAERMAMLEPVAMRLEVKEGRSGCTLINDSYNSDLNSLDIALDFMNRRSDVNNRKRTLILSDVEQTGEDVTTFYSKVARMVKSRGVEKFIGVGQHLSSVHHLFEMEAYFYTSVDELFAAQILNQVRNEVVLIKGARSYRFDAIADYLSQKVHETILEVNLNSVVANLNYYRGFLKPTTKVVCMVKASAYGTGAVEIAKTLQEHQVDYLAVAVADEGVELRKAGITANIMIMNPEMGCFKTLFEYDLEPEVYSFRLLEALIREGEREGVTDFPIHIKLDTGMHRLGFNPESEMSLLVEKLKRQTTVLPRSIFSHFVGSDNDEFDDFSIRQYDLFMKGSEELRKAYSHTILRHICNSAGIEHFSQLQMDMVRLGLGLYGVNPRNNEMLSNVSTLRTTILQIHEVKAGETVGYSRKGVLKRDSRVAALPIGYADGLDRKLGCGVGYCMVNGEKAPYVGNICMDVCMVDVTDIECKEGDTVVIFGEDLPVTILSDAVGTIPYEILTGVSNRVKRIYFQD